MSERFFGPVDEHISPVVYDPHIDVAAQGSYSDRVKVTNKTNDASEEIKLDDVEQAPQYFDISCNTSSAFSIRLRDTAMTSWDIVRPWSMLESLSSVSWNGMTYRRGDVIFVRSGLQENAVDVFEVADIRSLGDSRSVFRGFWYYDRSDMRGSLAMTSLRMWPPKYLYCKSTHTDIVMWDCATGHLSDAQKTMIVPRAVCDMSRDTWKMARSDAEAVQWCTVPGEFPTGEAAVDTDS